MIAGSPEFWGAHYKALFEREQSQSNWYQARLYHAWNALRGQTKGLQRQARLIKRLRAENNRLRNNMALAGINISLPANAADVTASTSTAAHE